MSQDPNAPQPGGYPSAPQQGGYPGAPQQPYPQGGQPHPAPGQQGAPSTPPKPLALAVKLMYVGAALSLVSVLSSFLFTDALRDQFAGQPGMDQAMVDTAVTIGLVTAVVIGLVSVGLWILNAVFNSRGKQWARILSTVLGVLAVISTLIGFTQPAPALSRVLSVVQMLLAIGIVVLLWRPESSRFYQAMSAPRY